MKDTRTCLVPWIVFGMLLLGGFAIAQEEPPAKDEKPAEAAPAKPAEAAPAKDEAAKPEAAPAAAPAAEAAAVPAAAAPAAAPAAVPAVAAPAAIAAAAPAAAAAPKALGASAMTFSSLADSYKKAYDDMQAFMKSVDTSMGPADQKIASLQAKIKENETAAAQAKQAGDDKKAKSLVSENKKLTKELNDAVKGVNASRGDFVKQAQQKVKEHDAATDAALQQLKK